MLRLLPMRSRQGAAIQALELSSVLSIAGGAGQGKPCAGVHCAQSFTTGNQQGAVSICFAAPLSMRQHPSTAAQVKWLRTIEVLDTHSTNHYHRHDNKVCDVPHSHSLL